MITEKTSVYFYRAQLCEIWFMIIRGVYCEICEHNAAISLKKHVWSRPKTTPILLIERVPKHRFHCYFIYLSVSNGSLNYVLAH